MVLDLVASRVVAASPEHAYARTIAAPLTELMGHRYGPIPPVKDVTEQTGDWLSAGQSRLIRLGDGGSLREHLDTTEPPEGFTYTLGEITGPMKLLISSVEGRWVFEPSGAGTTVTWGWRVEPKAPWLGPVLRAFGFFWGTYADRALAKVEVAVTA